MNSNFPRIIALLRKEKHISQKQAALDLGISQALLSHYEKGIRECGLDFVVKVSDYYEVSCDYLLGRSPDRSGLMLTAEELPDPENLGKELVTGNGALVPMLNKKLIANSLNILFDVLGKMKCKALTQQVSAYLMISVYKMFRIVYSTNLKNPQGLFSANSVIYRQYSDAALSIAEANAFAISKGEAACAGFEEVSSPAVVALDTKSISTAYPLFSSSLLNLIKNSEDFMSKSLGNK